MKNLKRSVVFLMVFAMLFTAVAPVFAATPTDVVGTTYEDAVSKLAALGIVAGDADTGNYRPADNITRAEFAKIVAYVVGLQTAAELSKTATKFKDVPGTHWAAGYVNVASEQGLIKGYPDKTFKPNANVSYAEAITILVRALGLGPVVEGKGTWPANYLSKASSVGVTEDVTGVTGNAKAIRGVIAQLAWNTLTSEMWGESKYTSTGVEYGALGKTLLKDKYADFVYLKNGVYEPKIFKDAVVVGTQLVGGLGAEQVKIEYTGIAAALGVTSSTTTDDTYKDGDNKVVTKVVGLNTIGLVGKKVDVFFGKDNKVVSFLVKSSVASNGNVDKIDVSGSKITIAGKEYTVATSPTLYVNTKTVADLTALKAILDVSKIVGTAILNSDGKITTFDGFVADKNDALSTKEFVVKAINSNGDVKSLYDGSTVFNLDTITGVTSSQKTVFVKNGKLATKADLKVGDVVTWVVVTASTLNYVVITDTKVTGTIASLGVDTGTDRFIATVNGTAYNMVKVGNDLMSKTGKDDDAVEVNSSYRDFNGKSATLSLDSNGQIMYTVGTVTATANFQYGVLAEDITNYGTRQMTVRTSAGTKVVYTVTGDHYKVIDTGAIKTTADADWVDTAGGANQRDDTMVQGTFVQYQVNADGTVSAENIVKLGTTAVTIANSLETKTQSVAGNATAVQNSAKAITVGGIQYYFTANSIVFTKNTTAAGDNKVCEKLDGWDAISNSSNNFVTRVGTESTDASAYIVYNSDSKEIKYLVVNMIAQLSTTSKYAVITSNPVEYLVGSDKMIKLSTESGLVEYKVATDVYSTTDEYTAKVGDFLTFTVNSDGKFVAGANATAVKNNLLVNKARVDANKNNEFDHWVVKTVDVGSKRIQFNKNDTTAYAANERFVTLTSDAKIYDISSGSLVVKSISDVKAGTVAKEFEVVSGGADDGLYKCLVIIKN